MIESEPRELTLIYHSGKTSDKKARAYVESLPMLAIKMLNLGKEKITETQLVCIAAKMHAPIEDLVDLTYDDRSPAERQNESIKQMGRAELLRFIRYNTKLLATPILVVGDRAYRYILSLNRLVFDGTR